MDTVGSDLSGQIPKLENLPAHNDDGAGGCHFYTPWWLYGEKNAEKLGFARGYHVEIRGSRPMPFGHIPVPSNYLKGLFGTKLKEEARRYYGSFVTYSCRGEMIPNEGSYAEIDSDVKDKWGIPVVKWELEMERARIGMAAPRAKDFRIAHR